MVSFCGGYGIPGYIKKKKKKKPEENNLAVDLHWKIMCGDPEFTACEI